MIYRYEFRIIGNYFYVITLSLKKVRIETAIPLESVISIFNTLENAIKLPSVGMIDLGQKYSTNIDTILLTYSNVNLCEISRYVYYNELNSEDSEEEQKEEVKLSEIIIDDSESSFDDLLNWLLTYSNKNKG